MSMKAMPAGAAAQLEVEQAAVELERGVDVADLERDVVDADEAGAIRHPVRKCRASRLDARSSTRSSRRRWAAGRRRRRWPPRWRRRAGSGSSPPATRPSTRCGPTSRRCARSPTRPFGVNLFAPPGAAPATRPPSSASPRELRGEAERYGAPLGEPRHDDDDWEAKLALMAELARPGRLVHVRLPGARRRRRPARRGRRRVGDRDDAGRGARGGRAGADALVVQGVEAGGHRGDVRRRRARRDRAARAAPARRRRRRPAAGRDRRHRDGPRRRRRARRRRRGRRSSAPRSCSAPRRRPHPAHREAIAGDGDTALTRAFTGRTARGIVNRWLREHDADAPERLPDVHHLTAEIRAAARRPATPTGSTCGRARRTRWPRPCRRGSWCGGCPPRREAALRERRERQRPLR